MVSFFSFEKPSYGLFPALLQVFGYAGEFLLSRRLAWLSRLSASYALALTLGPACLTYDKRQRAGEAHVTLLIWITYGRYRKSDQTPSAAHLASNAGISSPDGLSCSVIHGREGDAVDPSSPNIFCIYKENSHIIIPYFSAKISNTFLLIASVFSNVSGGYTRKALVSLKFPTFFCTRLSIF